MVINKEAEVDLVCHHIGVYVHGLPCAVWSQCECRRWRRRVVSLLSISAGTALSHWLMSAIICRGLDSYWIMGVTNWCLLL